MRALRKQFVVMQISASPDGRPDVLLSMIEERFLKAKADDGCPGAHEIPVHYYLSEYSTRITLDLGEYGHSGLAVGDRVWLEIGKVKGRVLHTP
jgi:hypothetical protein